MRTGLFFGAFVGLWVSSIAAAQAPSRPDVWDLAIGRPASEQPAGFAEFACGSNGGPPGRAVRGFEDFMECMPEESGLREVYFRYDDELEYRARARGDEVLAARYAGTQVLRHPAMLSVLISEDGVVKGIRILSDPRTNVETRQNAYLLGEHLMGRFGREHFHCEDLPREDREEPFGGIFVKQNCEATIDGRKYMMQNRFLLQPGQSLLNPHTREIQQGSFESTTRFEIYS